MTAKLIGLAIIGLPALLFGWLALRRYPPVFWFFVTMLAVGLGYLAATGAADDVARYLLGAGFGQPASAQ